MYIYMCVCVGVNIYICKYTCSLLATAEPNRASPPTSVHSST